MIKRWAKTLDFILCDITQILCILKLTETFSHTTKCYLNKVNFFL